MSNLECTQCGLAYLSSVASCPRCGKKSPGAAASRPLFWTAAWVLLVVVGGVAYYFWHARTPAYVEAIRSSAQFKRLATVRVNQSAVPNPAGQFTNDAATFGPPLGVTLAACVLEARGLLAFDATINETRTKGLAPFAMMGANGRPVSAPAPDIVTKSKSLDIRVTDIGRKDAVGWSETDEFYNGRSRRFWRVPVGEAEFVRVGQVLERPGEDGTVKATVEVFWRWHPNWIGQAFDAGSQVFALLPEKARKAAAGLNLDSRGERRAFAELERTTDGWKVVSVYQLNEVVNNDYVYAD
jgi:hypothetical protein